MHVSYISMDFAGDRRGGLQEGKGKVGARAVAPKKGLKLCNDFYVPPLLHRPGHHPTQHVGIMLIHWWIMERG